MLVLTLTFPLQAQFLKKLGQGLKKVNEQLDKVEKALGNDKDKPADKKGANAKKPGDTSPPLDERNWKAPEVRVNRPFLSTNTRYLYADPGFLTDVSDGVFGVMRGGAYEFWRVDGVKLFDADWRFCGFSGEKSWPQFVGGVAPAKRSGAKGTLCLLYLDGRVKECDPTWKEISNFNEGVALVRAEVNYNPKYFYINAEGQKVNPALVVMGGVVSPFRPLKNGLRAYQGEGGKWGFLDAKCNVVIPATYHTARDFSDGYAWVSTKEKNDYKQHFKLIDTKGNTVWDYGMAVELKAGDVSDDRLYMWEGSNLAYYDVHGKELARYESGNSFYDGKAFVGLPGKYELRVVDKDFNVLKVVSSKVCEPWYAKENGPKFEPFGLATVNSGSKVIDPSGQVVISAFDNMNSVVINDFKPFAESGYAICNVNIGNTYAKGLMLPTGELAWVISETRSVAGPYSNVGDLPIEPTDPTDPTDTIPKVAPQPIYGEPIRDFKLKETDWQQKAVGPREVTPVRYKVSVQANPADAGSVQLSPTGSFGYGAHATVTATAKKDWAVGSVTSDFEGNQIVTVGKPFAVTADQTITVNFVEKDKDDNPDHGGTFEGTRDFKVGNDKSYPIPIYAKISKERNVSTPYGEQTYGFLVPMFDPTERYTDGGKSFAASIFAAPLMIYGQQTDPKTGKKYLVLDGGDFNVHDLKVSPAGGGIFGLMMDLMIKMDGFSNMSAQPRHYRIEILDEDPATGEFTCGYLQTYSPKAGGWVAGGDRSLTNSRRGMFGSAKESGYDADFFYGIRMKATDERTDVQWYPPETWCNNANEYDALKESMQSSYKNAKSDYRQMFPE